ncbi:hypothetical protein [Tellurirhabdus bombi]|uniref:hypothetical protein n=1 Tax=Tellurirhabdus bombi TaxID=2907205 RepID=UPI001F275536|nr:hypothetical protein [Tellurirhabdus bombi]
MEEKKKRKPGGGRKPKDASGKKEQASWWLAPDVVNQIRLQPNQAEYIESLVRKDMDSTSE